MTRVLKASVFAFACLWSLAANAESPVQTGIPDLIPYDVLFYSGGGPSYFVLRVKNIGQTPSTSGLEFRVRLKQSARPDSAEQTFGYAPVPGANGTVDTGFWSLEQVGLGSCTSGFYYSLQATVDLENDVPESNETNNTSGTLQFLVRCP